MVAFSLLHVWTPHLWKNWIWIWFHIWTAKHYLVHLNSVFCRKSKSYSFFFFYPSQQCNKMHSGSKQSEYKAAPENITSTNSSHKGKFCWFLFWLTLQSTQLKEIHMWIQFHLVHHLSCLLYLRQLQLCKPSDGIRGTGANKGLIWPAKPVLLVIIDEMERSQLAS